MTSMTGGEAIVSGLVAHGVDTVFGLPGAQIYGLFDAFHQAQLKVIGARHEQACGYMAFGYARSSGKVGVFSVVPGPGVLNAGTADRIRLERAGALSHWSGAHCILGQGPWPSA
jgi:acetolactate synthase I/II/III large subunit